MERFSGLSLEFYKVELSGRRRKFHASKRCCNAAFVRTVIYKLVDIFSVFLSHLSAD